VPAKFLSLLYHKNFMEKLTYILEIPKNVWLTCLLFKNQYLAEHVRVINQDLNTCY